MAEQCTCIISRLITVLMLLATLQLGACGSENSSSDDSTQTPALASISIADSNASEGDTGTVNLEFTLVLSMSSSATVSVNYQTADITATAGIDYQSSSGQLQFAPGMITRTIAITINGDSDIEASETLRVTLSSPVNATLASNSAIGTINNDDFTSGFPGIDNRPDNQSCIAPARPSNNASVSIIDPFMQLPSINAPTKMLLEPVADPRWFVLSKTGELVVFDPDSATAWTTYLDLSAVVRTSSEGGLLGMAFHPDYPSTPEIFLSYTIDHSGPAMRSIISRFILDDFTTPAAGTVEQVILRVDQDFDNHNGGDIAFGPDGYLYIGLGDGGDGGDPNDRSQDTRYLLGSMLRIDVLGPGVSFPGNPYDIPPDNRFAGNNKCGPGGNVDACPEIYAWGLRNPWRWSFDPDTGNLWLADVGQGAFEEVDIIEAGGNYGWRCREGMHDFNLTGCNGSYIDPVSEVPRALGRSITGGFVYRGTAIPELIGRYVFADYATGRFWALQGDGQGGYLNDELIDTNFGPSSFAVDQNGELYFTDINNNRLRMLVPAGPPVPDTIPELLSNSGCTDPGDVTLPYPGLLPYDLNAPFWSDAAVKDRYIGLPNGSTMTRDADDDWDFPNGTVIVKNFRLNGNLVETRHLMRHPDGIWAGYTYEWNPAQTEATRVRGGKSVFTQGQDWIFPSESQCMECHSSAAGFALGPETVQLNRVFTYPSTARIANQLETIEHVMMFTSPLAGPVTSLPSLTSPTDTAASLDHRARAYLHTNCAQCHRPGGPTPSPMDLRYTTLLGSSNACDAIPTGDDLGIVNARLIAPGDSSRSVLLARIGRRDSLGMPPLGSNLIDSAGITLLGNWINSLVNCLP